MSLTLNTSILSATAIRSLYNSRTSMSNTVQRLSTGIKLNSASDNAADLSLSKGLQLRTSGISMANRNIQTGISKLQSYDGYLSNIHDNLQRIRNLAVQASNGTYAGHDRDPLNQEAQYLIDEIKQASSQANQEITSSSSAGGSMSGTINPVTQMSEADAISNGYTVIKDAATLQSAMNSDGGGMYMLMNDIDLSSLGTVTDSVVSNFWGTLDGNGYTLKNLTINGFENCGLIGTANGATIKNIIINNANITAHGTTGAIVGQGTNSNIDNCAAININIITGNSNIGGIIASNSGGNISNCYATGELNNQGFDHAGGIVGRNSNGTETISNCYSSVNVSGGGLVGGISGEGGVITSCYNSGTIAAPGAGSVGGIAGGNASVTSCYNTGNISGDALIGGIIGGFALSGTDSCYNTGNVTATSDYAGGITGYANGTTITSCFSTGTITATNYAGGIVGYGGSMGDNYITGNSFTGTISGSTYIGGISGALNTATAEDNTNFWNTDTSGLGTSAGNATGMDTATFNAQPPVYSSWSTTDWDLSSGTPTLKAFTPTAASGSGSGLELQIGEKTDSTSIFSINDLQLSYGSTLNVDLSSDSSAKSAIDSIDTIINYISDKRSSTGSSMMSLNAMLNSNSIRNENLTSSTSTLKDTDMAIESAKLAQQQIKQNLSISILQQAKTLQQTSIFQLLGAQ